MATVEQGKFLGYKKVSFEKSVASTHPNLLDEWHPTRNLDLLAGEISSGSTKKVWWQCGKCGHEWEAMVQKRVIGTGCPACVGLAANEKNCMAATHPHLSSEFNYERNAPLTPWNLVAGSNKSVWWRCSACGYDWSVAVANRKNGSGCPACRGKRVTSTNSMAATHPQLAADFDLKKNGGLTPESLVAGTSKKLWWSCQNCGHEWKVSGSHRSRNGCPGCAHKVVTPRNCMAVTHPVLSLEFHPNKNGDLTPFDFIAGSPKRVWWICNECGGEWLASCNSRRSGKGCPTCRNGGFNQSLPGVLYVLCGDAYGKIGISNQKSLAARLNHHRQKGLFGPLAARFDFVVGGDVCVWRPR